MSALRVLPYRALEPLEVGENVSRRANLGENDSMWRHILDGHKFSAGTDCKVISQTAKHIGYTMFSMDSFVYAVTDDQNPLKYPLFKVTDIPGL